MGAGNPPMVAAKKLWIPGPGVVRNFATFNLQSGDAGTRNLQHGGIIDIAGGSRFTMGKGNVAGWTGRTTLASGSSIRGAGVAEFSGDGVEITGGDAEVRNVDDDGAEVKGSGNLEIKGTYNWGLNQASHWKGTGFMLVQTGATLRLPDETIPVFKSARKIYVYGTMEWDSSDNNIGTCEFQIETGGGIQNFGMIKISNGGNRSQRITAPAGATAEIIDNRGQIRVWPKNLLEFDIDYKQTPSGTALDDMLENANYKFKRGWKVSGGNVHNAAGSIVLFESGVEHTGGEIVNNGEMIVFNGYLLSGGTVTSQNNTNPVKFTADLVDQTGGTFLFIGTTHDFTVTDTYAIAGGTATVSVPYIGSNMALIGHIEAEGGQFNLGGRVSVPEDITVATGGSVQLNQYADIYDGNVTVDGNLDMVLGARINGNLTNNGLVHVGEHNVFNPGETVYINGNYTQTSAGTLRMDVSNGPADRLSVSGIATLAGTLQIVTQPGFVLGTLVTLMTYGSRVGVFDPFGGGSMTQWYDYPFPGSMGIKPTWM
jgi:hypothetical protein